MRLIPIITLLYSMVAGKEDPEIWKSFNVANDDFTSKLFKEAYNAQPDKSLVLSAFSVLTPLAQLSFAAEGKSHNQLLWTMGFKDDAMTELVFDEVEDRIRSTKGVTLKTASSIYVEKNGELNDAFVATSKKIFKSDVRKIDFTEKVKAAKEINGWVEEATENRIKDLVDPDSLGADTAAILVNAIYFKGSWENKFDIRLTAHRDFHVSDSEVVNVELMNKKDYFRYGESGELDSQLLELFYEGGESSFVIVLPKKKDGLPDLVKKISNPLVLNEALANMRKKQVNVFIPKFKIETTTDLKDILTKIGLTDIFVAGKAHLNKLLKTNRSLFISDAKQKAFIEVDENGAEAAAANEFGVAYLSALIENDIVFNANHPFVFLLKHQGTIIFNGVFIK